MIYWESKKKEQKKTHTHAHIHKEETQKKSIERNINTEYLNREKQKVYLSWRFPDLIS